MHMGKRRSPKTKHESDRIMEPEHIFFLAYEEFFCKTNPEIVEDK
jgi:hypothetical protein